MAIGESSLPSFFNIEFKIEARLDALFTFSVGDDNGDDASDEVADVDVVMDNDNDDDNDSRFDSFVSDNFSCSCLIIISGLNDDAVATFTLLGEFTVDFFSCDGCS